LKLLLHFTSKFVPLDHEKPTQEFTLLKDIIFEFVKSSPFMFIQSSNACSTLHKLFSYYAFHSISEATSFSAVFSGIMKSLEEHHPNNYKKYNAKKTTLVPGITNLLSVLLEMTLDSADPLAVTETKILPDTPHTPQKPKSEAYERVTLIIAVTVLADNPRYILQIPNIFRSFLTRVIKYQEKESNLTVSPSADTSCHIIDWICYVLKKGYYTQLSLLDKPSEDQKIYHSGALLVKDLSQQDSSVMRYIGLQFLELLGGVSQVKSSDTTFTWRPEFLDLLNKFGTDKEVFISTKAQRIITTEPISFTESSFTFTSSSV